MTDSTADAVLLLRQMIRNQCVNDGTPGSGSEGRSAEILADHLAGDGLDVARLGPVPGRESVIARIEGTDPGHPSLMLMGHTDVVPADPEGWDHDPFGAELIDGMIWGRGAIDMLSQTATMAVAFRRLADSGWRPRGTLIYLGVADEEAGGAAGAQWLIERHWDDIRSTYLVSETGGVAVSTPQGQRVIVTVAEKGMYATRIHVRGTPSHGSRPYAADNALIKAAEVIRRLAAGETKAHITDAWRRQVAGLGYPPEVAEMLVDPDRVRDGLRLLDIGEARTAHALTHLTASPNVCHGGSKTNTVPGCVTIDVDVRLLPGQTRDDLLHYLDRTLGDLMTEVEIEIVTENAPTETLPEGPLWEILTAASRKVRPRTALLPSLTTGGSDSRFFRARGVQAFGFAMFSDRITLSLWESMFHARNERVDIDSLTMSVDFWQHLAHEALD